MLLCRMRSCKALGSRHNITTLLIRSAHTITSSRDVIKYAGVQMKVTENEESNISKMHQMVREAAHKGAELVVLPVCGTVCFVGDLQPQEMWSCPISLELFRKRAESIPGKSSRILSDLAKELGITIVGGTIPEKSEHPRTPTNLEKVYNTCLVFGPNGELITRYRKVSLFDAILDVDGKDVPMQESAGVLPGEGLSVFRSTSKNRKLQYTAGLGICYDLRFPSIAAAYSAAGCQMFILVGGFPTMMGSQWNLLQQSRYSLAMLRYMCTVAPAHNPDVWFQSHGHSAVIAPTGNFVAAAQTDECIVYGDIDLGVVADARRRFSSVHKPVTYTTTLPS